MVGLMVTSSKRAYGTPGLLLPEPQPCGRPLLTHTSTGGTQTLKGRSDSVSVETPGAHKVLFGSSKSLWQVWGLILNVILPLLLSCWGLAFALGRGVSFMDGQNGIISIQNDGVEGRAFIFSWVNQPYIHTYPPSFWISFPFRSPQCTK